MKRLLKLVSYPLLIGLFFSVSCQKELDCYECEINKPPVVNAGRDLSIMLPQDSILLNGNASADADGKIAEWLWTKIAGPTSFFIANASASTTMTTNLISGIYSFELKVTDDKGASARDTVQVAVNNPLLNEPPIACAGFDKSIILPINSVTLDASCSTDPNNNIARYQWSNVSGPSSAIITNATIAVAQTSGLLQGVYQFQLQVTDSGGLSAKDTIKVTVAAAPAAMKCGETNRPIVNANLIPIGTLSEPAAGMSVTSAGNKIFFTAASFAGTPPLYGSSTVNIYDIITQAWSTANLSVRRADVSAIAAGGKVFFAGGRLGVGGNADAHYATVDIYDIASNSWSASTLSQARAYVASATVGDKVFFAGGEREWPYPVSDRVDIYDLSTNTWSQTSLAKPRSGITAVTANNKVYFAGGSNQIGGTDNVENLVDIYDNATKSWSTGKLNEAKTFFAGINLNNKIYWAGGYTTLGEPTCKVETFDVMTQVTSTTFLSQPSTYVLAEGQNAVVKDDKIVWFATIDPLTGTAVDKFNIYNVATNAWSIGVLPFRISGASIISVNNIIYVAGGSINGKITNQVWKLEF